MDANEGFNRGVIKLAKKFDKLVKFRYAKGDGRVIEDRYVTPTDTYDLDDKGYFGGVDPDRGEYRAYRIDRIKGAVVAAD